MKHLLVTLAVVVMLASGATAQTITPTGLSQGDLVGLLQNIVNALGSNVGATYMNVTSTIAPIFSGIARFSSEVSVTGHLVKYNTGADGDGIKVLSTSGGFINLYNGAGANIAFAPELRAQSTYPNYGTIIACAPSTDTSHADNAALTFAALAPGSTSALTSCDLFRLKNGPNHIARVNALGNFTIGATDLAGSTYKFYIDASDLLVPRGIYCKGQTTIIDEGGYGHPIGILNNSSAEGSTITLNFGAKNNSGGYVTYAVARAKIYSNISGGHSGGIQFQVLDSNVYRTAQIIDSSGEVYFPLLDATTASAANAVLETGTEGLQLKKSTSSRRYKKDIESFVLDWTKYSTLRPVSFRPKEATEDSKKSFGFIAEEMDEAYPELVSYNENGEPDAIHYGHVTAINTAAIKALKAENDSLRAALQALTERVAALEAR